jgi:hypothetical protein
MPILREGSPGRLPDHPPTEPGSLQEILDTHRRLLVEYNDLAARATQLDSEVKERQREMKDIRSRQREIIEQKDGLTKPRS